MKTLQKQSAMLAGALTVALALTFLTGCETFVADGDDSVGINERGGFFYLLDNEADVLVMLDRNMVELANWPYSDFTTEGYVQGLTFDGASLWASVSGGDDLLYQLDLSAGEAIKTLRTLPAPPNGQGAVRDLAWDGKVFWVLNSGSLTYNNPPEIFQIDPVDGAILSRHELPSAEPRGMCFVGPNSDAYGRGARIGCYYTDKDDDFVYVFETARFIFHDGFAAPAGPRGDNYIYPLGIFFDGEKFWSTNSSGAADYMFALDYDGTKTQRVDLPYGQPGAIVWVDHDLREAPAPLIQGVSPSTGGLAAHKTVIVRGVGFQEGLTVDFGVGVAVDSLTFTDPSKFTTYITVAADADLGARNVTVTNPDGQQGVGVGLFSVVETDPSLGSLWILDNGGNTLVRYAINDNEVVANYSTVPVAPGGSVQGLAFDETNIWLSAGGTDDLVVKIDTLGVLTTLQAFTAPPAGAGVVRDMTFDGTDLWIPNSGSAEIFRVDPADGTVLETIPAPALEPRGVAWADGKLYCNDKDTDTVYVWDPGSTSWSAVFETPVPPGGTTANRYPTGMAWDGFSFWLCNSTGEFDYIFQVSPEGTLLSTLEMPDRGNAQPTGIVFTRN